ncbi:MAG: ATP-binding protein [Candidatus Tyrphobacter sp.]
MHAARILLLGQPRVFSADGTKEFHLPRKTLNVLAYAILHRKRPPSRDALAFALFPDDDEEAARASLRRNLSYLLSSLPPAPRDAPFLRVDADRIAWNPEAQAHVDVIEFERAIEEERDDDAIAEYGGQLLPTLYDEWTTAERERLCDVFHSALIRTIARDRSRRHFDTATASAHRLLDDDPWREDIVRQLMAIRYESGDRAGALAAFERFALRLRDEMHAGPMPETVAVRDAILRSARLTTSEPPRAGRLVDTTRFGLPFVGRDAAMEAAIARWHAAADGRAGVLLVAGEAGIGKSRFATELARTIDREGGLVIRGETAAGSEHRPYEAFVDALKSASMLRVRDADVWRGVLDELLDEHAHARLTDDRSARVRIFDSVRRGITDLARSRPVCVILEDLHWAGPATVDLLEFVALRLSNAPVLIVATFRSDELSHSHPLRALSRQLEGRGNAQILTLQRLGAEEAMRAVRSAAPSSIGEDALLRTVAWAEGVPLLLAEALRDLSAGRAPAMGDIASLVGERLVRLSEKAETALVYGAVLGARFELATLAATTGWNDGELVDALGESIDLGLIRAATRSPGLAFAFVHHLVRTAAIERVSQDDLVRAHALTARALASLPGSGGARAAEIARQLEAASDRRGAAEQLLRAASYALDVFANEEARDAVTSALVLLDATDSDRDFRYDLIATRERALTRIGATAERRADAYLLVELADDDVERGCDAWERVFYAHRGDAGVRDEALSNLRRLSGESERAAAIFERTAAALALLETDFPRARDAAARSAEYFERAGDSRAAMTAQLQYIAALGRLAEFVEAQSALARLRPLVEAEGDLALLAEFHRVASSVADEEHRDLALESAKTSVELAMRIGDRFAEARARQNVAVQLGRMRDIEGALREHERALEAYTDVGDAGGVADSTLNLASVRGFCGDHAGAQRLLAQIDPAALRQPWLELRVAINGGALALSARLFDEAERQLTIASELAATLRVELYAARVRVHLGELSARTGKSDDARRHLDEGAAGLAALGHPALQAEALALSSRLYAGQGEAAAARADAAAARELAQHFVVQHFGETAWHLAAAYALIGDTDDTVHFAEAAARAFADGALRMPADLVDGYARLPWHRHAFAYLAGRQVPLRLDEAE